jgi:plastocyanin
MGNLFKLLAGITLILIVLVLGLIYIKQNPPVENVYLPSTSSPQEFSLFNPQEIKKITPPTPTKPLIISSPTTSATITHETTFVETSETTTIPETQLIKIIAKEYKFEPDLIKVKAGEKITLIIKNEGLTPHDFKISNEIFSIKSDLIAPGQEVELNFILPKKGEYEFYCTLHLDKDMKGKIIAE